MDSLLGVSVGLALSTAAGLRIFVPLLITSAAAQLGYITLAPGMTWIGTGTAFVAFATATVVEVAAYYVPWFDNLLDTIAMPVAMTAGVIATAAVTPDLPPLLRWTIAIVAGGGAAGLVQAGSALLRLKSSLVTTGAGNPILATAELVGAVGLAVLGVLVPLLGILVVAIVLVVLVRRLRRSGRARPA